MRPSSLCGFRAGVLAGRGSGLAWGGQGVAQALGVDKDGAHGAVVTHYVDKESRLLEEIGRAERVRFVELCHVEPQLHVEGRFGLVDALTLECGELYGDALHLGQGLVGELFEEYFHVGLDCALDAQAASYAVGRGIGVVEVVVAVVDEVGLEHLGGYVGRVCGDEAEHNVQFVAAPAFDRCRGEGDGLVVFVIVKGVDIRVGLFGAETAAGFASAGESGAVGAFEALCPHRFAGGGAGLVVVGADDYALADKHGDVESVLIAHKHRVLVLETGDGAAAHFVEKSNFISYFHRQCVWIDVLSCKDSANERKACEKPEDFRGSGFGTVVWHIVCS